MFGYSWSQNVTNTREKNVHSNTRWVSPTHWAPKCIQTFFIDLYCMLQQTLLLLPSHVVRIFSMPVLLRIDDNVASRTSRFLVSFLLRLINENSRFKSAFECGKHSTSFTPHSQVLGTGAYLSVLLTYVPPYISMQWNSDRPRQFSKQSEIIFYNPT